MSRHVIFENATDHRRFGFVYYQVRRGGRGCGDSAIAIRHFPEDDFAAARTPQLAAPIALGNFGALVLGDHALNLDQQASLRIVVERGCVGKQYPNTMPGKLIQHDHLIGIQAGQAIRRKTPNRLDDSSLRGVA